MHQQHPLQEVFVQVNRELFDHVGPETSSDCLLPLVFPSSNPVMVIWILPLSHGIEIKLLSLIQYPPLLDDRNGEMLNVQSTLLLHHQLILLLHGKHSLLYRRYLVMLAFLELSAHEGVGITWGASTKRVS